MLQGDKRAARLREARVRGRREGPAGSIAGLISGQPLHIGGPRPAAAFEIAVRHQVVARAGSDLRLQRLDLGIARPAVLLRAERDFDLFYLRRDCPARHGV